MIHSLSNTARFLAVLCLGLLSLRAGAGPIPIDADNFTADPAAAVTFNPDGSATMFEDDFSGFTLLTNAPPTEPQVIVALPNTILSFNYEFTFGPSDAGDGFRASLLQSGLATGDEFFTDVAGAGLVEFDLDALGLTGVSELGIEFALESGFDDEFGSTVLISNLRTRVPLPTTFLLLGAGLMGLLSRRRRF